MTLKSKKIMDELKNKSVEELQAQIVELKRDRFVSKSSSATSGEKKGVLNKVRNSKKQIARILMVLRERELHEQIYASKS